MPQCKFCVKIHMDIDEGNTSMFCSPYQCFVCLHDLSKSFRGVDLFIDTELCPRDDSTNNWRDLNINIIINKFYLFI